MPALLIDSVECFEGTIAIVQSVGGLPIIKTYSESLEVIATAELISTDEVEKMIRALRQCWDGIRGDV